MKKLLLTVFLLLCPVLAGSGVSVQLAVPEQMVVGVATTIEITGLTDTNYYIITSSFSSIANYTFQASGYSYDYLLTVNTQEADTLTLAIYDYSTTTGQNSSTAHMTRTTNIVTLEYYDQTDQIIDMLVWIGPLAIVAIFVVFLVRALFKH